jgi:chemotaxis response regulator CheB
VALRLIIADDDALARALIEAIVARDGDLELVGSAEDAERSSSPTSISRTWRCSTG